jgi:hypothetical protein
VSSELGVPDEKILALDEYATSPLEDALVELTAAIAWENSSSKFNRALRVPSQRLWKASE